MGRPIVVRLRFPEPNLRASMLPSWGSAEEVLPFDRAGLMRKPFADLRFSESFLDTCVNAISWAFKSTMIF